MHGTECYNRNGDHLGTVDHMMLDKISGQVEYVVMSFGGFLGIGESYHPLPWRSLTYDTRMGGYVVDADRARLEGAAVYVQQLAGLERPHLPDADDLIEAGIWR